MSETKIPTEKIEEVVKEVETLKANAKGWPKGKPRKPLIKTAMPTTSPGLQKMTIERYNSLRKKYRRDITRIDNFPPNLRSRWLNVKNLDANSYFDPRGWKVFRSEEFASKDVSANHANRFDIFHTESGIIRRGDLVLGYMPEEEARELEEIKRIDNEAQIEKANRAALTRGPFFTAGSRITKYRNEQVVYDKKAD